MGGVRADVRVVGVVASGIRGAERRSRSLSRREFRFSSASSSCGDVVDDSDARLAVHRDVVVGVDRGFGWRDRGRGTRRVFFGRRRGRGRALVEREDDDDLGWGLGGVCDIFGAFAGDGVLWCVGGRRVGRRGRGFKRSRVGSGRERRRADHSRG